MSGDVRQISGCEVCGQRQLATVLDLGSHPLCDDLVAVGDSRTCAEYPIEILYCDVCRTAHQRFQVPKQQLFPETYHYRARFTKDVLDGMNELVDSCERRLGPVAGKRVLDIGCNDGSLLGFFRQRGARTFGIEPTGAWHDAAQAGHAVQQGFLSERLAAAFVAEHGSPDIITFTNVFAHIENLPEVLQSVRRLRGPATTVVIENHYLGAVLDTNQFDTFYHEHPRTYSYTSFAHIARSLDVALTSVEFPGRYGGNIRVFLGAPAAVADGPAVERIVERERAFGGRFAELRDNIVRWRLVRRTLIADNVRRYGPLAGKAFPGRAAILFKLLDLDEQSVAAVHEKPGSMKIGHYVPGTRVPIVSDDELFAQPPGAAPVLNLAWHIPQEIRSYLAQHGVARPVIDVVSPADFAPVA